MENKKKMARKTYNVNNDNLQEVLDILKDIELIVHDIDSASVNGSLDYWQGKKDGMRIVLALLFPSNGNVLYHKACQISSPDANYISKEERALGIG